MPTMISDCPRCKAASITFDILSYVLIRVVADWQPNYEAFSVCRACNKPTIFGIQQSRNDSQSRTLFSPFSRPQILGSPENLNSLIRIQGHVSLKDESGVECPEHTPGHLKAVFDEGAACFAIGCYNASVAMFRLCLDLDTKAIAKELGIEGMLNSRLKKLFAQNALPSDLEELSHCIRENGNDGAHDGTISSVEAEDIMDFAISYLESRYTLPERIRIRREERRNRHQATEE